MESVRVSSNKNQFVEAFVLAQLRLDYCPSSRASQVGTNYAFARTNCNSL
jgi:hypothetical protein